ncbi:DeoR family transcriptional regulator [Microbulbifer sp. SH-1]|uniref:DeoR/GlpR family DNA-binding transcription regulator n=1 Tax=Microbulbifer sp. SH-1 TaxID=2681547 RepID=UPI00140875FB|nr:DeoR/GlpR family DNA-binding transcription regulator [Microbulbifer sp. SH-1]QIL88583.1 DeoR family transcriptional regulator [Microbulbifer sp. SH-1]
MLESERHQLILTTLSEQDYTSVRALCEQVDASEATVRRDLTQLEREGKIKRKRGGAEISASERTKQLLQRRNGGFLLGLGRNIPEKRQLAKRAVEMCEDGESIIINGGSSTYMMGEFLKDRNLSILTNSYYLALDLIENSDNQITLPGGEVYRKQGVVLSPFENDTIPFYHASKMFMGTPGIGNCGVMESDPLLIRAEHKLRKQAEKLIVLADSSKLGKRSNFIFEPLENIDVLITDSRAKESDIKLFERSGIEVVLVDCNVPNQ